MKKYNTLILLVFMMFFKSADSQTFTVNGNVTLAFSNINANNIKVYVKKSGGERKALLFGRAGYETYHYYNCNDSINLVCTKNGLHKCKIDKIGVEEKSEIKLNRIINKAIRKSERKVRRSKSSEGLIYFKIRNYNIEIKYKDADKYGNGEFEIILTETV